MKIQTLLDQTKAAHKEDQARSDAQNKAIEAQAEVVRQAQVARQTADDTLRKVDARLAKAIQGAGGMVVDTTETPPVLYTSTPDGLSYTPRVIGSGSDDAQGVEDDAPPPPAPAPPEVPAPPPTPPEPPAPPVTPPPTPPEPPGVPTPAPGPETGGATSLPTELGPAGPGPSPLPTAEPIDESATPQSQAKRGRKKDL